MPCRSSWKASLMTASVLWLTPAHADEAIERNWFDDPFFVVRSDVADCPLPRGPYLTEQERRAESHYRVERGTSCYREGRCTKPNSYLYDPEIATAVRAAFEHSEDFHGSSLWVTVTRRFVIVQGCAEPAMQTRLEAMLAPLPDVERVIVEIGNDRTHPAYRLRQQTQP